MNPTFECPYCSMRVQYSLDHSLLLELSGAVHPCAQIESDRAICERMFAKKDAVKINER